VTIREGPVRFRVRPGAGQKTGFFCDQRENRLLVGRLARGRLVLDCCCYTGGFALQALAGGARAAVGVDLDETALLRARENARLNNLAAEFVHADIFDYLRARRSAAQSERPDLIVLDPAKQAKVREELPRALAAYTDMSRLALEVLPVGGLLFASSCSGLVAPAAFLGAVKTAAEQAGRELTILQLGGAGPDHPVAASCPETGYLKTVLALAGRRV
jgi:23S rRNA (cytosine1962-C5)-methyltransferase